MKLTQKPKTSERITQMFGPNLQDLAMEKYSKTLQQLTQSI